jgi:Family of unknown function (DUF6212)
MNTAHPCRDLQQMSSFQIITDPESLRTLFNGEIKIIVSFSEYSTIVDSLQLPSMVAIYACARLDRDAGFDIFQPNKHREPARVPLPHPPVFCLALIAASAKGKKELDTLREIWSGGGEGFLPSPILINLASDPATAVLSAHRSLFDGVVRAGNSWTARLLALQRQYTAFRIVHDQLQNAFDTVENFLARSNLPSTWLAFACEPTETFIGPLSASDPSRLTQLLPVPSQGLAALELHATHIAPDAEGLLDISIETCEDCRILGDWAVPYNALTDGWIFLDLPEIDIVPRQSAKLTVIWNTRAGSPPKLSLSQLQPLPESRVQFAGNENQQRSLALRLHIGLPGSRRIAHPFHVGIRWQPHITRLGHRLSPNVLRRCADVTAAPGSEALVRFLEDSAAIQLRPVNGGVTVAKLAGAVPAKARRLTATIRTEDPASPVVEYALLALNPNDPHEAILQNGLVKGQGGAFSGWLSVHPDFATQIHLNMTEPAVAPLDLYLATRLAAGQKAESAEARWLEFIVDGYDEMVTA